MSRHKLGDVVILLPGILGSVLEREGKEVWGPSPQGLLRALWTLGRSVRDLELHGDPLGDPQDGVTATRLMPDVHIIPGLWGIDGYSAISAMLTRTFDVVQGKTFIEFPYDWRLSNTVSAHRLADVALPALHEQRTVNPDAKLILIAHSMGGLISRYFLECLDGAKDTRMLISFGTPYRGSLNALGFLANGFAKRIGPLKVADLSALVRSLPSVHELLPIYPCVSSGDGPLIRVAEADGLPQGVDRARAHRAEHGFHGVIEAAVSARGPAAPYFIHPVVGLSQPTLQSARLADGELTMLGSYEGDDLDGDGTVPRVSATPSEFDGLPADPAVYASERHASLQNATSVLTQLLGLLRPVDRPERFRDLRGGLRLVLGDLYEVGEAIPVTVVAGVRRVNLLAKVQDADTGRPVAGPSPLTPGGDGLSHTLELAPVLPQGCYRLIVSAVSDGAGDVQPVHGLFLVAGDEP
jgi:hypothetical protein